VIILLDVYNDHKKKALMSFSVLGWVGRDTFSMVQTTSRCGMFPQENLRLSFCPSERDRDFEHITQQASPARRADIVCPMHRIRGDQPWIRTVTRMTAWIKEHVLFWTPAEIRWTDTHTVEPILVNEGFLRGVSNNIALFLEFRINPLFIRVANRFSANKRFSRFILPLIYRNLFRLVEFLGVRSAPSMIEHATTHLMLEDGGRVIRRSEFIGLLTTAGEQEHWCDRHRCLDRDHLCSMAQHGLLRPMYQFFLNEREYILFEERNENERISEEDAPYTITMTVAGCTRNVTFDPNVRRLPTDFDRTKGSTDGYLCGDSSLGYLCGDSSLDELFGPKSSLSQIDMNPEVLRARVCYRAKECGIVCRSLTGQEIL
jgi:hypothetical protein